MAVRPSSGERARRRPRHMEERMRAEITAALLARNNEVLRTGRGEWGGRIDWLSWSTSVARVKGDAAACEAAAVVMRAWGLVPSSEGGVTEGRVP